MIHTLELSNEEFASRRRAAQDRLVGDLAPAVAEYMASRDPAAIISALRKAYEAQWIAESDLDVREASIDRFISTVETMLEKITDDSRPETVALALSLAVLNDSTNEIVKADNDPIVTEWVTMRDSAVREAHENANGQQRPAGEWFDVGGVEMPYPGWMGAPVGLWINCRCVLRPARMNNFASREVRARRSAGDIYREYARQHGVVAAIAAYESSMGLTASVGDRITQEMIDAEENVFMKAFLQDLMRSQPTSDELQALLEAATHDLIWVEGRRTPKVVPTGEKYEPSEAEGKITKRRKATEDEEKTIANGDWVRVNEDGKKPGDPGYKEDRPSEVRPQHNALEPVCTCCGGTGEHADGHECYGCDATGLMSAQREVENSTAAICPGHHGLEDTERPEIEHYDTQLTLQLTAAAGPAEGGYSGVTHAGIAILAADTGRVFMAQRAMDETDDPEVQETWEFPGGGLDEGEQPFAGAVRELIEETGWGLPDEKGEVVNGWRAGPTDNYQGFVYRISTEFAIDSWTPTAEVQAIAWWDESQVMAAIDNATLRPELASSMDWSLVWDRENSEDSMDPEKQPEVEPETEPADDLPPVPEDAEPLPPRDERVRWHGVLAPEGVRSGDGRTFDNGSLRLRNLPLPFTWQELSADGHDRNIAVGSIDKVARIGNEIHWSGFAFSSVPEADEFIGIIAEMGRYGISVDCDDIGEMEFNEETEDVVFKSARISSACGVSIPAFQEAYVALGAHPILDAEDPQEDLGEVEVDHEALVAGASFSNIVMPQAFRDRMERSAGIGQFVDVAPGITEDGPGWLTHPVDTDRLRDYWVRGEGAAKIGWGTPGDFNRCRVNLAEYIEPQHLNGYCANRHFDALGSWPGQNHRAADAMQFDTDAAPSVSLVAAGGGWAAPSEFFVEPTDAEPADGIQVDPETGRVWGYLAEWGTCHIGFDKVCVTPPPSNHSYSFFNTGTLDLDNGKTARVGTLTIDIPHADVKLAAVPAAAHYDNTEAGWAWVTAGENDKGIWLAGVVIPGTDPMKVTKARAAGRASGDWRGLGGELELVAALTVNVGGFQPNPRTSMRGGTQVALVAAGIPKQREADEAQALDITLIASSVADELERRQERRETINQMRAKHATREDS